MAYGQWVSITIINTGNGTLKIANLRLSSGKLHLEGDKNHELSLDVYNGAVVKPGYRVQINACGRENAPEGTTGSFDLIDASSGELVRNLYWDSPWGPAGRDVRNCWRVGGTNRGWNVEWAGGYLSGGALGGIEVRMLKK